MQWVKKKPNKKVRYWVWMILTIWYSTQTQNYGDTKKISDYQELAGWRLTRQSKYKFRKKVLYKNNVYIITYSNWYDMQHRVWPTNVNYGFSVTVTCHCRFTGFNNGGVPAQVRLYEKSPHIPLFCCDLKITKKYWLFWLGIYLSSIVLTYYIYMRL